MTQEQIDALVQEKLSESLKDIKGKLDGAFAKRDEALKAKEDSDKKLAELEKEKRDAELLKLQEEGKHKEVYEAQLATLKAEKDAADKEKEDLKRANALLSRDIVIKTVVSKYAFQSDTAAKFVARDLTDQAVCNENGVWVHKTGITLDEYMETFQKDETNAFLFKQKRSSGSGSQTTQTTADTNASKSLFERSQAEVLKMAAEGKLPPRAK